MEENNPTQIDPISCPVDEWPPDLEGRQVFLLALRRVAPEFWREVNRMWRAGEQLDPWFEANHIVDHWLKLAVFETLLAWKNDPDGPNASLAPNYPWYSYSHRFDTDVTEIPNFQPRFSDPYPTADKSCTSEELFERLHNTKGVDVSAVIRDVKVESIADFEARMTRQFREQLRAYSKKVVGVYSYGSSVQRLQHAEWAARVFMGETRASIGAELHRSYENAENAVQRAVTRFARDIGLTLPPR